ncbi:hypothetical protein GCM10010381_05060 [Streptomyces xantholiticus]|nr:hypothetical protein GCM10010381_05060 [Streptomyces xantholiticus]
MPRPEAAGLSTTGCPRPVAPGEPGRLVPGSVLAFAFSMWLVPGSGHAALYQGVPFLFAGVLV